MDPESVRNYQRELVLPDGFRLQIRSIRPDDKIALVAFFRQLSHESVHLRFLADKKELTAAELAYFTEVDFVHHVALVALLPEIDAEQLVGVGRYIVIREEPGKSVAEIGLLVMDKYQGKGVGKALLVHLAELARNAKIHALEADILRENVHVRELFKDCGYRVTGEVEDKMLKLIVHLDVQRKDGGIS